MLQRGVLICLCWKRRLLAPEWSIWRVIELAIVLLVIRPLSFNYHIVVYVINIFGGSGNILPMLKLVRVWRLILFFSEIALLVAHLTRLEILLITRTTAWSCYSRCEKDIFFNLVPVNSEWNIIKVDNSISYRHLIIWELIWIKRHCPLVSDNVAFVIVES